MRSYIYLYFHIDLVVSSECFTVNCKYCYQSPQNWCSVGFMLADIVLRFIYVRRLNVSATRGHHNKGEVVVTPPGEITADVETWTPSPAKL